MENYKKLKRIAEIIEHVDDRCVHADGPVTPTLKEMTQEEMIEIYELSKSADENRVRENQFVMLAARLETICAIFNGEEPSDFMLSFPEIQRIYDLYIQSKAD